MTTTPSRSVSAKPVCLVRWVFHRGNAAVTCAVEAAGRASYDVCVLPHWNLSEATVEHYDAPASALCRHAAIASRLRQAGWVPRTAQAIRRASRRDRSDERQAAMPGNL
jgi:hypothetical protein